MNLRAHASALIMRQFARLTCVVLVSMLLVARVQAADGLTQFHETPELRFWAEEYTHANHGALALNLSYVPLLTTLESRDIDRLVYVPRAGTPSTSLAVLLVNATLLLSRDHVSIDTYLDNVAWISLAGTFQRRALFAATYAPHGLVRYELDARGHFTATHTDKGALLTLRGRIPSASAATQRAFASAACHQSGLFIAFIDAAYLEQAWMDELHGVNLNAARAQRRTASARQARDPAASPPWSAHLAGTGNDLADTDRAAFVRDSLYIVKLTDALEVEGVYAISTPDVYYAGDGDVRAGDTSQTLGVPSAYRHLTSLQCSNDTVWVTVRDSASARRAPRALGALYGARVERLIAFARNPRAWLRDETRSTAPLWSYALDLYAVQQLNKAYVQERVAALRATSTAAAPATAEAHEAATARLGESPYLVTTCVLDNVVRDAKQHAVVAYNPLVVALYSNGLALGFGCDVTLRRLIDHEEMTHRIKSDDAFKRRVLETCQSFELGPGMRFLHRMRLLEAATARLDARPVVCSDNVLVGYAQDTDRDSVLAYNMYNNTLVWIGNAAPGQARWPVASAAHGATFESFWQINQRTAPYWVRGRPFVWPRKTRAALAAVTESTPLQAAITDDPDVFAFNEEEADVSDYANVGTGIAIGILISVLLTLSTLALFLCVP